MGEYIGEGDYLTRALPTVLPGGPDMGVARKGALACEALKVARAEGALGLAVLG